MTGKSTLKTRLAPEVLEEVEEWISAGRVTLDRMSSELKSRGYNISRSALDRYKKIMRDKISTGNPARKAITAEQKLNLAAGVMKSINDMYPDKEFTGQEDVLALAYHAATDINRLRELKAGDNF